MTYHPEKLTVSGLFGSFYQVPEFQRQYAWTREQLLDLVNDVFGGAEWTGDANYFIGSVVTVRRSDETSKPYALIDGQQRLTTLSLLIRILLNNVEAEKKLEKEARETLCTQARNRLYEVRANRRGQSERNLRLKLQPSDGEVYKRIIDSFDEAINAPEIAKHPLIKAAHILSDEIRRCATANRNLKESDHPYYDMLLYLSDAVEVVRINADSESDAFRLFEALNDRGLGLSSADLVKNKILARASATEAKTVLSHWEAILANTQDEAVAFLRTAWIADHSFVRKADLYNSYRDLLDKKSGRDVSRLASALQETSVLYADFLSPKPDGATGQRKELLQVLRRLNSYNARSCRPAILAARKYHKSNLKFQLQVAQLCEAITVRYSLTAGRNPNVLEKLYANVAAVLRKSDANMRKLLELEEMKYIPSDKEFSEMFAELSVGKGNKAWFSVLVCLNEEHSGGRAELDAHGTKGMHIEHILPQNPSIAVASSYGFASKEDVRLFSGLIGNLTLLGEVRNKTASAREFKYKKSVYARSDVSLTRSVGTIRTWNAVEIKRRSQELAKLATQRFALTHN